MYLHLKIVHSLKRNAHLEKIIFSFNSFSNILFDLEEFLIKSEDLLEKALDVKPIFIN